MCSLDELHALPRALCEVVQRVPHIWVDVEKALQKVTALRRGPLTARGRGRRWAVGAIIKT